MEAEVCPTGPPIIISPHFSAASPRRLFRLRKRSGHKRGAEKYGKTAVLQGLVEGHPCPAFQQQKPALLEYTFRCTPLEELAGLSVMEKTPSQCLADN
jgi:hypothetical protein